MDLHRVAIFVKVVEASGFTAAAKVLGLVFNNDARPLYGYDNNYKRYFTH